ncbi:MAG TPA: O-antigen ligase family protein [Solirubrobacteraceae bacterium]|nr:O-antigen ligase family protein [Solirubrobacteraceae bacterium]
MAQRPIALPAAHGSDRLPNLRSAFVGLMIAAVAMSATGMPARRLFSQPDDVKYLITVAAPLLLGCLALTADPARWFFGLAVVAAPFTFVATFNGVAISPLIPLLCASGACLVWNGELSPRRPALGAAAVAAAVLLAAPIAFGSSTTTYATWLTTLLVAGWVTFKIAERPGGLDFALTMLVVTAFVQALLAIWGYKTGQKFNLYQASGASALGQDEFFSFGDLNRPAAAMPDPISLGNVLALSLPLTVVLACHARDAIVRAAFAVAGTVIGVALVLTFSRMSWIGAALGMIVAVVLLPSKIRGQAFVGVIAGIVLIAAMGISLGGRDLRQRFDSIQNPTSSVNQTADGDRTREGLWHAALETAAAHPVFGTGFGKLPPELARRTTGAVPAVHAHSTYLQFLAEAGVAGALALLLVIVAGVRDLISGFSRNRALLAGAAGSLACLLAVWLTDYTVRYAQVGAVVCVLLGAIAGQARIRGREA